MDVGVGMGMGMGNSGGDVAEQWWEAVVAVDDGGGGSDGSDELAKCGDAAMRFVTTPVGMLCIELKCKTWKDCLV